MTKENETVIDPKIYEVSFIFDNKMDEAKAVKKAEDLKLSIATFGGSFISEEVPYMRELAYEMIRVQNNVNVRFTTGYFGWIKFELSAEAVKSFEKSLQTDEEIVRALVIRTVRENTVFTKRQPAIKQEVLEAQLNEANIDTTLEAGLEKQDNVVEEKVEKDEK